MIFFILWLTILPLSTAKLNPEKKPNHEATVDKKSMNNDKLKEESNDFVQKWMKFKTTYSKYSYKL
jgi:hypothetical protein